MSHGADISWGDSKQLHFYPVYKLGGWKLLLWSNPFICNIRRPRPENHLIQQIDSCVAWECGLLTWPRWFSNRCPSHLRTLGVKGCKIHVLIDHTLKVSLLSGLGWCLTDSYHENQHLSLVWTKYSYKTHFKIYLSFCVKSSVVTQIDFSWAYYFCGKNNSLYSRE